MESSISNDQYKKFPSTVLDIETQENCGSIADTITPSIRNKIIELRQNSSLRELRMVIEDLSDSFKEKN